MSPTLHKRLLLLGATLFVSWALQAKSSNETLTRTHRHKKALPDSGLQDLEGGFRDRDDTSFTSQGGFLSAGRVFLEGMHERHVRFQLAGVNLSSVVDQSFDFRLLPRLTQQGLQKTTGPDTPSSFALDREMAHPTLGYQPLAPSPGPRATLDANLGSFGYRSIAGRLNLETKDKADDLPATTSKTRLSLSVDHGRANNAFLFGSTAHVMARRNNAQSATRALVFFELPARVFATQEHHPISAKFGSFALYSRRSGGVPGLPRFPIANASITNTDFMGALWANADLGGLAISTTLLTRSGGIESLSSDGFRQVRWNEHGTKFEYRTSRTLKKQGKGTSTRLSGKLEVSNVTLNTPSQVVQQGALNDHDQTRIATLRTQQTWTQPFIVHGDSDCQFKTQGGLDAQQTLGFAPNFGIGLGCMGKSAHATLHVGRRHTTPSLRQRFFTTPFSVANPELRYEQVSSARFHAKVGHTQSHVQYTGALSMIKDTIVTHAFDARRFKAENMGRSWVNHQSLTAVLPLPFAIQMRSSLQLNISRLQLTGADTPLLPRLQGFVDIGKSSHTPFGRFHFHTKIRGRTSSSANIFGTLQAPAYMRWSAGMDWDLSPFLKKTGRFSSMHTMRKLTLSLLIDNMLDQKTQADVVGLPLPPRTFMASIRGEL